MYIDDEEVKIKPKPDETLTATFEGPDKFKADVKLNEDGTFQVTHKHQLHGQFKLILLLNEKAIFKDDLKIQVNKRPGGN